MAFVNWLLTLGNGGAASNAKYACDATKNEAARLDAALGRLLPPSRVTAA